MRNRTHAPRAVRLNCELLEDRVTPVVVYALSGTNLLSLGTAGYIRAFAKTALDGVVAGETLVGITTFNSSRPIDSPGAGTNPQLIALGVNTATDTATVYRINPDIGAALPVGTPGRIAFTTDGTTPVDLPAPAAGYTVGYDPVNRSVLVSTGTGLNFRVDPFSGAPVDGDNGSATAAPGVNPDAPTTAAGPFTTASSLSLVGTSLTRYTLDSASDSLNVQNLAGAGPTGRLTVNYGGATLDFTAVNGFDVPLESVGGSTDTPTGYATLTAGGATRLFAINLATGEAALVGDLRPDTPIATGLTAGAPVLTVWPSVYGPTVAYAIPSYSDALITARITPYDGYDGAVTAVGGNVNGDGYADVVTGAAVNGHVKVFDGTTRQEIRSFLAFQNYAGGVYVATGDVNGDGYADVIVGSAVNGHVKVFSGQTGAELYSFVAPGDFAGGARVAGGNVESYDHADIIVGGAGGRVYVFSGATGREVRSFLAYPDYAGGVSVAAGDVDRDGIADIITGADANGHVKVVSGATGQELRSFLAFPGLNGPVRVTAGPVDGNGYAYITVSDSDTRLTYGGLTFQLLSKSDVIAFAPGSIFA